MKANLLLFVICFIGNIHLLSAQDVSKIKIIPQPVKVKQHTGVFKLTGATIVKSPSNVPENIAGLFVDMIKAPTGYLLKRKDAGKSVIQFALNAVQDTLLGKEGYRLSVTPSQIKLQANQPAGLFYGMQTLMQLLPNEIASRSTMEVSWTIPCTEIVDYPRFGWRGLMLDVSRHFFTKDFVKKYIDQLAQYKMNVFHWHLTDDQGWRMEIKSLPKLTSVGAWRAPRLGRWWNRNPQYGGEQPTYGGFYTQDDVREIVKYAKERYVIVLPEIDVPGHSLAAIAAYPELSCTGGDFKVNVGNLFYGLEDNSLCAGNEESYAFMDKVLTEVADLFPGEYIHIGGDEAYKGFWADCDKCKQKMKDEGLQTVEQLQSYFIRRMEKIVKSKGKKLIGWNEILEGGLAPGAAVMSWQGFDGGIAAAKMNQPVVMTPASHCYLDLYQGDSAIEPPTYSLLRLNTSYSFEPIPEGVNPALILGGQGNLWTESVPNPRQVEYMTWPRAFALAEVLWSSKTSRNWDDFVDRVEHHFERFDYAEVNYATSMYDAIIKTVKLPEPDRFAVTLTTEVKGLDFYYTFDNTYPDKFSPQYTDESIKVPRGADTFRVITYRNNKPIGKMITLSVNELQQR
jgi:hexosaminidase